MSTRWGTPRGSGFLWIVRGGNVGVERGVQVNFVNSSGVVRSMRWLRCSLGVQNMSKRFATTRDSWLWKERFRGYLEASETIGEPRELRRDPNDEAV